MCLNAIGAWRHGGAYIMPNIPKTRQPSELQHNAWAEAAVQLLAATPAQAATFIKSSHSYRYLYIPVTQKLPRAVAHLNALSCLLLLEK